MTDYEQGWADAIAAAAKRVRRDLAYNDQRAVSWHEVQDCAEAISALTPPAQPSETACTSRFCSTCGDTGVVDYEPCPYGRHSWHR